MICLEMLQSGSKIVGIAITTERLQTGPRGSIGIVTAVQLVVTRREIHRIGYILLTVPPGDQIHGVRHWAFESLER